MAPLVWLITGTSSGFGASMVQDLLTRGDKVIATARTLSKVASLGEAGAATLQLDVTSPPAELRQKAAEAVAIYGRIDVLVNNAGNSHFGTFEDATPEDWQAQMGSNFFGPIYVTQAFLPYMRKQRSGTIVFISSLAGFQGIPTLSLYCASKHAITGAAASLAGELSDLGIRTLTVSPGFFRTELLNPNSARYIETKFDDYNPMIDAAYEQYRSHNGNQAGDPAKGAARIVDLVKGEGLAKGKEFPKSLYLGGDCVTAAIKQAEDELKLLKEWEEFASNTDHS